MSLRVVPLTLSQANCAVAAFHRHHKPLHAHRFSLGAIDAAGAVVGCAIVGRPVAFSYNPYSVAEVSRLATNGAHNACSILYGACARTAKAMGFEQIQTYTLPEESGASLRAVGWQDAGVGRKNGPWAQRPDGRTRHNLHPIGAKRRWYCTLAETWPPGFDPEYETAVL